MTGGLLAGCASSQMSRIDANRDLYESWPLDVKQAVLDGKVEVGMTPEMVEVSWGKPAEKVAGNMGDEEVWIYRRGGSDGSMMPVGGPMVGMGGGLGGIGIQTGAGGTAIGTTSGIGIGGGSGIGMGSGVGIGGGMGGMGGMGAPVIMTPPTPPDEREVVFRNGTVYRADPPFDK